MRTVLNLSVACILFCGCMSSRQLKKLPLEKRYSTIGADIEKNNAEAVIDVIPVVLPVKESSVDSFKSVFSLASDGQKAYIKAIATKSKDDFDKFASGMNQKFFPPESDDIEDYLTRKIQLVFTVNKKIFDQKISAEITPGDRIESLKISFQIDSSSPLKFSNFDKFATQYGQFNIAGTSFTTSKEVNINPSIPLTAGAISVGSFDNKSQYTVNDSLKQRFILLNGTLQDDNFTIFESGTREIDLESNSAVNVTMDLRSKNNGKNIDETFSFKNLKTKGSFTDPKNIELNRTLIFYPDVTKDITGTMTCSYKVRHIIMTHGDQTFYEGDDDVQEYKGSFSKTITIVKAEDITQPKWEITVDNNTLQMQNVLSKTSEDLNFSSYRDAENFIDWMVFTSQKIDPKNSIEFGNYILMTNTGGLINRNMAPTIRIKAL